MSEKIWKKIVGLLSIFVMLFAFTIVDAKSTNKGSSKEYKEAIINKFISKTDEKNNLYDIVLEIEGKNKAEVPPTDIILVVDESNSMNGSKFEKAMLSVKTFSNKLLLKVKILV